MWLLYQNLGLVDEQHLPVLRQRPARVVDELLEPVDRLAEVVHRHDLLLVKPARKRLLEPVALDVQVVEARAELERERLESGDADLESVLTGLSERRGETAEFIRDDGADHRARDFERDAAFDADAPPVVLEGDLQTALHLLLGEDAVLRKEVAVGLGAACVVAEGEGEVADEIQASLADFSDYIGGQTLARSVKFCECAKDAAEVEWNDGTIRIKVSKLDA